MTFVQTISFKARDEGQMLKLFEEWDKQAAGAPGFRRAWILKDRDEPNAFLVSVEFSSYEKAMQNSSRPETDAMAKRLREMVDGSVEYGNYDLIRGED